MGADVPDGSDRTTLDALRSVLQREGFTVDGIEERLGTHELSARPVEAEVHRRRAEGDDPFSTLARLFLIGDEVAVERVDRATRPLGADRLEAIGLLAVAGGRALARVRLVPHGDYYVASDAGTDDGADLPYDHVPGIQAPSVTLAKLAVRTPCRRALDLGTGCGIQALLAAKHAEGVVATDVNPRALAFAAFNAALNDVSPIELRLGDAFAPVEGDEFDLIVANPPYVISPDASFAYRDSGLPADDLCRSVVRSAAGHLREGGFAHVLVSWAHARDGGWDGPLRTWVAGTGCDAWLLHYRTSDPIAHAASWLRPLGEADPQSYAEALDRWLGYLRRLGIEAIGYGAVVLRRRDAIANWVRTDPLPLDRLEPAGPHTLRVFAGTDAVEGLDDAALLELRLAVTEPHRLAQHVVAEDGRLVVESQTLELTDGLRLTVGVDRHTVSLLPHLDGRRPLREVLARARETFELDAEERERFAPAALPVVRRLLELGFLEPR